MDVMPIGALPRLAPATPGEGAAPPPSASFGQLLKDSLAQVNALQRQADAAVQSFATGASRTLHDTMLAMQRAELSFRLMTEVRDKIVEAYQEILRMQV